jgi:hypothetical protein
MKNFVKEKGSEVEMYFHYFAHVEFELIKTEGVTSLEESWYSCFKP